MRPSFWISISLFVMAAIPATVADDGGWPQELTADEGSIIIYQPQVERFDGTTLEARTAVAVKLAANDNAPVFGAIWIVAQVETDRDERMVYVRESEVTDIRLADFTEAGQQRVVALIEERMSQANLAIALDRLVADLDMDEESLSTEGLKHDPPEILFSTEPAVLVMLDGDPILQAVEGTELERVVNTPFLIAKKKRTYYLAGSAELWYAADAVTGPWSVTRDVPGDVERLAADQPAPDAVDPAEREVDAAEPPKIIVATRPTELIVADGEARWKPIEAMGLLYLDNTDADVFLELSTQKYYVLLSGRWYRSDAVIDERVWEHVPNDELPAIFTDLDEDGVNGDVLAHVAGTEQARSAALDGTVPQTAAVKMDSSAGRVEYDGEPQFVPVEDVATVQYAANTSSAVFRIGAEFYLCDQAVWYSAASANGPWKVAAYIPAALYDIPPSNPHHNVTYVYIYDRTPEVVYVGYTPGYVGSYHYHGCVVWGTGWWYRPWYGRVYYPRTWTWGLRMHYNPWTGWSFGLSFSNGPFTFSFGRGGAWFGVGGFRPWPRPYVRGGFRKTNINVNVNRNVNVNVGDRPGGGGRDRPGRENLYDRPQNRERNAADSRTREAAGSRTAQGGRNDVLTDRAGNVYRRDESGGWQERKGGEWQRAENLDRASTRERPSGEGRTQDRSSAGAATGSRSQGGATTRGRSSGSAGAARPQLERDYSARQRGNTRTQQYSRSRSAPSRGGGRRR